MRPGREGTSSPCHLGWHGPETAISGATIRSRRIPVQAAVPPEPPLADRRGRWLSGSHSAETERGGAVAGSRRSATARTRAGRRRWHRPRDRRRSEGRCVPESRLEMLVGCDVDSPKEVLGVLAMERLASTASARRLRGFDGGEPGSQPTAIFTSAVILASTAGVISVSAYALGHIEPSSRWALSLKPRVAYLTLNFARSWKKQMSCPSR